MPFSFSCEETSCCTSCATREDGAAILHEKLVTLYARYEALFSKEGLVYRKFIGNPSFVFLLTSEYLMLLAKIGFSHIACCESGAKPTHDI